MVMVDLRGLHAVKAGRKVYYYAWRGGPAIKAPYGTPEFFAEWEAAKHPGYEADKRKFSTWVELFRRSNEYKAFAKSTKRVWEPWLARISAKFGNLPLAAFDRPLVRVAIRKWRDEWHDKPRAADYAKQVLSRVCAYAVAEGVLRLNPCPGIPNVYQSDRADRIWTVDDLEHFCRHASKEVADAARLAALTGLRQGDLLSLSWGHVGTNAIEIKTAKSRRRRRAAVPLTQEIRDLLEAIPKRSTRILTNTAGLPWRGFSSSWNETLIKAEMTERDLHFHDFRGTAATNYYRAGFTIREIAETLGWSGDKVGRLIDLYVKKDEIMVDRIRRLESFTAQRNG